MKKLWYALTFALRAFAWRWRYGDLAMLAVGVAGAELDPEGAAFRVECTAAGHTGVVYEGASGADARRAIERLRNNPAVDSWKSWRNGDPWDWGPRQGEER